MNFKLLFVISLLLSCAITSKTLDEEMTEIENSLKTIADKTKESYLTMCSGCDVCSNHACSAKLRDDIDCEHDFGTPDFCTHCKGRRLEKKESYVNFANENEIVDPASPISRQTVCFTSKVQQTMLDVRNEDDKLRKWTYIATSSGLFRVVPGSPDCNVFDPRLWIFYISAFSGSKVNVIAIDNSINMSADRLTIAKEFAKRILSGLGNTDQFLIVSYSNVATENAATLQTGNIENIAKAKEYINGITLTNQQASILVGLAKVYDVIQATKAATTLNLNADINVIVLSSGYYTGNNSAINNLVTNRTSNLAFTKKINYNTFSINNLVDSTNILRNLACGNRGIYNNIANIKDVAGAVESYYTYIRSGQQNKAVIWTEPYLDFTGMLLTTAALAVYDDTVTPNFLIGTVAMDIHVEELSKKYGSVSTLTEKFRQTSLLRSNTGLNLSECQLDNIRSNKCQNSEVCAITVSTIKTAYTQCPVEFSKVWCEDEATFKVATHHPQDKTCCRCILKSSVALIAVGWCLFGLTLFILLIVCCCSNKREEDYDNKVGSNEENRFKSENNQEGNWEKREDNQA